MRISTPFENRHILFILAFIILPAQILSAQDFSNRSSPQLFAALNVKIHLNPVKKGGANHLTLGASIGTAFRFEQFRVPSLLLQTGINLYAKGLGTNILDTYEERLPSGEIREHRRKFQMDWVTAILGNLEWGPPIPGTDRYLFPFVHFNQMTAYSLQPVYFYNVFYGTQFVFNTQHRNQQLGVLGFNSPYTALAFYNDGTLGPLVCDDYDRFWTGGGHLRISLYNAGRANEWINTLSLEYHYDRFTYDVQDGYRLANILLIPNANDQNFFRLMFNNAITTFKVNYLDYNLGYSVMGRSKIDIQDGIHKMLGYPKHLTYASQERLISLGWRPVLNK